MEAIFHEKQEGSLCAQHCLNALLQGSYFTPVDLATLAQQMDDEERIRMAESGVDTEDYRRFLEQPSGNYDDSGYFSVQVISSALEVWGLELIPYNSSEPRALEAQQCPEGMQAYICNYHDHWFTIRRLGHQWFNLNSLLTGPQLISDTYLAMFLAQLQQEGYSIFVVSGPLPECEADSLLRLVPAVQTVKPQSCASAKSQSTSSRASHSGTSEDDLQRAIKLSLGPQDDRVENDSSIQTALSQDVQVVNEPRNQDDDLQRALSLSLQAEENPPVITIDDSAEEDEEIQLQKALSLSLQSTTPINEQEDSDLERALKMSLECCDPSSSRMNNEPQPGASRTQNFRFSTTVTCESRSTSANVVDAEEIRRRRLAYLEANSRPSTSGNSSSGESIKKKVNT